MGSTHDEMDTKTVPPGILRSEYHRPWYGFANVCGKSGNGADHQHPFPRRRPSSSHMASIWKLWSPPHGGLLARAPESCVAAPVAPLGRMDFAPHTVEGKEPR